MMERQPCMSPILEALLRSGMGIALLCCMGPAPNTSRITDIIQPLKLSQWLQLPTVLANWLLLQLFSITIPLATKVVTVKGYYCQ